MTDTKEVLPLLLETTSFLGFRKKIRSADALHVAKTSEFAVSRLKASNNVNNRGALKLATNNIKPLINPLFSINIQSAKYAKHDGIPNPNEKPKRMLMAKIDITVKLLNNAGNVEVITPKIIHK